MPHTQAFTLHALELGPMENFVYLIHDHASGRAAVVDPAWDVPQVLALARREGLRITDILLTTAIMTTSTAQAVLEKHDARLHLLKEESALLGPWPGPADPAPRR